MPEEPLRDAIQLLVVRHDQVRVAGHAHQPGVDALALEHVELVEQHRGVDDDAVADDRHDPRIQHTARNELELEDLAVDHDRVARVVAALIADAQRSFLGEEVGETTLAFVAPLHADDHCARHRELLENAANVKFDHVGDRVVRTQRGSLTVRPSQPERREPWS